MYNYQLEQQRFWKNLGLSFIGHALFIVVIALVGKLSFSIFGNEKVEIIRAAVRVDVVGMPKYTLQELKEIQKKIADNPVQPVEPTKGAQEPIAKKEEAQDVIKEGDLVIQKKDKEAKKSLSNLLSNYSDKKVKAKEVKQGSKDGASGKDLDSLIIEGNRLSKGSSLVGDYSDTENTAYVSYVQAIPELIKPHWKLPSYLLNKNLRCRIRLYIGANGQILKTEVYESSGQSEFDTRAEMAIKNSAPFPAPSQEVTSQLSRSGVILGFPL